MLYWPPMEPVHTSGHDADTVSDSMLSEQFVALFLAMAAAMVQLAEEYGLTKIQLFNLYAIAEQGGDVPMSRIAQTMHCDASNVTGIVDRLVAGEFLTRVESPRDRRAKLLKLTPKGDTLIAAMKHALPERIGCGQLDAVQRCQLSVCLAAMRHQSICTR